MTSGYYCAIFPFCGGGKKKKKDDKKTKAFYDWATTGIPVKSIKVVIRTVFINMTFLLSMQPIKAQVFLLARGSYQNV